MKKTLLAMTALMMVLLLSLSGCAAASNDLMAAVHAAEKPANPSEPDQAFVVSVSDFSWNLFRESVKNPGNVLISPASVYIALAMALNGSDTGTRTAMLAALSASGLSLDELNETCRDWMALLMNVGHETKLSIANSIWYRQGFEPDQSFLQRNADFFSAAARALDFNQESALETINGWVKSKTQGKIDKIVDKIDPAVVMYLINAVYFKAEWQTKFTDKSIARAFTTPSGSSQATYMHRLGSMDYFKGAGARGISLPYKDGRFAFVAILPDEGTTPQDLLASWSSSQIAQLMAGRIATSVDLRLPKFETRFEDSLKDELAALGMGAAFDPDLADFSLMNKSHEKNLYISEVKHKTYCRVDEEGTEAAAVTSVEVSLTSMPVSDCQLYFDRPFIYGIIDTTTGLPLFLGIMENPAEA
jgi:serine protease inhibitor